MYLVTCILHTFAVRLSGTNSRDYFVPEQSVLPCRGLDFDLSRVIGQHRRWVVSNTVEELKQL